MPVEHQEIANPCIYDKDSSCKTLGIIWQPHTDCSTFKIRFKPAVERYTKRKVLSEISSLFDPMGWISPSIVQAKLLLQKLWLTGVSWDEEVPIDIHEQWLNIRKTLCQRKAEVQIPRWVNFRPSYKSATIGRIR